MNVQQPTNTVQDAMLTDAFEGSQPTQSTQQLSQPESRGVDQHLWGFLMPCSASLHRIDLMKIQPVYYVGRAKPDQYRPGERRKNDIVLPGLKISYQHCKISWDGKETNTAVITVSDMSSNGTFINGVKIGKGRHAMLRDGNEIAFGSPHPQHNNGLLDYRFIFRHCAGGLTITGLHKHYELSHELGKGAFATVMKAISKDDGQLYALKIIQTNKLRQPTGVNGSAASLLNGSRNQMFAREISIMEHMHHPNVCKFKEVFYEDYTINLVLEYVDGGDLLDYIIRQQGIPEPEAKHITYQICDALAYIHTLGIAHRDLKPENVLLTTDIPPRVKVADFGLAKAIDSLTVLRTMCGTPGYLAPEVVLQANHNAGYDQIVDSWSVGVIVFSMLTQSSPFITDPESSAVDVRTHVLNRRIDWYALHDVGISDLGDDFVHKLLEQEPTVRLTMQQALEHHWLRGPVVAAALEAKRNPPPPLNGSGDQIGADSDEMPMEDVVASQPSQLSQPSINHVPGAFPNNNGHPRGLPREPSRTAPLQRRTNVLYEMSESGQQPPDPSWPMVQRMSQQDLGEGSSDPNAHNKRKLEYEESDLTPPPEDEQDIQEPEPRVLRAKRGRTDEDEPSKARTVRGGKAPAVATRTRPTRGKTVENEDLMELGSEVQPPRRSPRTVTSSKNAGRKD